MSEFNDRSPESLDAREKARRKARQVRDLHIEALSKVVNAGVNSGEQPVRKPISPRLALIKAGFIVPGGTERSRKIARIATPLDAMPRQEHALSVKELKARGWYIDDPDAPARPNRLPPGPDGKEQVPERDSFDDRADLTIWEREF